MRGFRKSKNKQILEVTARYVIWNPKRRWSYPTWPHYDQALWWQNILPAYTLKMQTLFQAFLYLKTYRQHTTLGYDASILNLQFYLKKPNGCLITLNKRTSCFCQFFCHLKGELPLGIQKLVKYFHIKFWSYSSKYSKFLTSI